MKVRIVFIIISLLNIGVSQITHQLTKCIASHRVFVAPTTSSPPVMAYVWVKVFEDNFDGNKLDIANWWIKTTSYCLDREVQCNTVNNVEIHNGALHLIAKKENSYCTSPCEPTPTLRHYTSGQIRSRWFFPYGKFEARVKIPKGVGFWPAYWTVGAFSYPNYYSYSEIDIFEFWTDEVKKKIALARVVHTNSYHSDSPNQEPYGCSKEKKYPEAEEFSQSFSVFSAIWEPNYLYWYVRGKRIRKTKRHIVIPFPPPFWWLGTHYVLKAFPVNPMMIVHSFSIRPDVNDNTPFPAEMIVDWTRYYRPMNCADIKDILILGCRDNYFPIKPKIFNNIIGKTITIQGKPSWNPNTTCVYEVPPDYRLDLIAHESITLGPGFHAKEGSYFNARIQSLPCTAYRVYDSTAMIDYNELPIEEVQEEIFSQKTQEEHFDGIPRVFPNPTYGTFYVDISGFDYEHCEIKVINTMGKVLYKKVPTAKKVEIDISDQPQGIYAVCVYNKLSNKFFTYKILKQ